MSRIKDALKALAEIPRQLKHVRAEIAGLRKAVNQRGKALEKLGRNDGRRSSQPLEGLFGLREAIRLNVGLEKRGIQESAHLFTYQHCDVISEHLYRYKIWEPTETRFVMATVKRGDVVIDLGANIGYYTVICSKLVGPRGQVHAFEPDDRNYQTLQCNLALNDIQNVKAVKAVVSDAEGIAVFGVHPEVNNGAHMVVRQDAEGTDGFTRTCHPKLTLDRYLEHNKNIDRIDFIKMDTQGSEVGILKGAKAAIEANRRHLKMVIEFCPDWVQQLAGLDPIEYLKWIESMGFQLFFIDKLADNVVPLDDVAMLMRRVKACDGITWPKDENFADLVVVPRGFQGALL